MRHLARFAAAGLATGLVATACGGTGNILQGRTPAQIIQLASSKVSGLSYQMALHGTVSVDTSGVQGMPAGALNAVGSVLHDLTMDGNADVQNPQRMRMTMTMSLLPGKKLVAVFYDGAFYISMDGGASFASVGSLNLQGLATTPDDIKTLLSGATNVKDLGLTTHDGERVEHLQATLGPNYIDDALGKLTGGGNSSLQQFGALLKDVFKVTDGTLDAYVRTNDGRVEAVLSHMVLSMDMAKLMAVVLQNLGGQVPSGSGVRQITGAMAMTVDTSSRFTDYGATITVSKPTVDPNAPGLPNLFGSM
jgi:hypothetical protein